MGRKILPNTLKLQVADGKESPAALVAFTNQVCAHEDTFHHGGRDGSGQSNHGGLIDIKDVAFSRSAICGRLP